LTTGRNIQQSNEKSNRTAHAGHHPVLDLRKDVHQVRYNSALQANSAAHAECEKHEEKQHSKELKKMMKKITKIQFVAQKNKEKEARLTCGTNLNFEMASGYLRNILNISTVN
jgi:hypothetical protein